MISYCHIINDVFHHRQVKLPKSRIIEISSENTFLYHAWPDRESFTLNCYRSSRYSSIALFRVASRKSIDIIQLTCYNFIMYFSEEYRVQSIFFGELLL